MIYYLPKKISKEEKLKAESDFERIEKKDFKALPFKQIGVFEKFQRATKDTLRCLSVFFKVLLRKNNKECIYVAVIAHGGMGDRLRANAVINEIVKILGNVCIDVYSTKSKFSFSSLRGLNYFLNRDSIFFLKKKYDLIYDFRYLSTADVSINTDKEKVVALYKNIQSDMIRLYKKYGDSAHYLLQKDGTEKGITFMNVLAASVGVDPKKEYRPFVTVVASSAKEKFGISKEDKYITIQHGIGDRGRVDQSRCWLSVYWERLLFFIKCDFPDIKIIRVGVSDGNDLENVDISLTGKTNLNELSVILKDSKLHIDCDGGIVHLAYALNVKSVVIFGPSNVVYSGYLQNDNIASSICSSCYYLVPIGDCPRKLEPTACMGNILPEDVFEIVRKNLESKQQEK